MNPGGGAACNARLRWQPSHRCRDDSSARTTWPYPHKARGRPPCPYGTWASTVMQLRASSPKPHAIVQPHETLPAHFETGKCGPLEPDRCKALPQAQRYQQHSGRGPVVGVVGLAARDAAAAGMRSGVFDWKETNAPFPMTPTTMRPGPGVPASQTFGGTCTRTQHAPPMPTMKSGRSPIGRVFQIFPSPQLTHSVSACNRHAVS